MAFRPNPIQYLKHGKLLSKKTAPTFVETWNWLAASVENICGDYDTAPKEGFITVDKAVGDTPVVRLRLDRLIRKLEDILDINSESPGCFNLEYDETLNDGGGGYAVSNPYYRIGGKTYECTDDFPDVSTGIVALKIDVTGSSPSATYEQYSTLAALQGDEADTNYFISPLYTFDDGEITCDWRKGAPSAMFEF